MIQFYSLSIPAWLYTFEEMRELVNPQDAQSHNMDGFLGIFNVRNHKV